MIQSALHAQRLLLQIRNKCTQLRSTVQAPLITIFPLITTALALQLMASKCTASPPENHITKAKVITVAPIKNQFRLIVRQQTTHITAMTTCVPLVISQNRRA
jgi:hypothetical protein